MGLHLNFLRWRRSSSDTKSAAPLTFSRRRFLQGTTVAASTVDLARALFGPQITFRHDGPRASFSVDGVEKWVLDAREFAGSPVLRVHEKTGERVALSLRGARYVGTQVPIELEVLVERRLFGWNCSFTIPQQNVTRRLDLRRWLEGESIEWQQALQGPILPDGSPLQIWATHAQGVTLDRSWNMALRGDLAFTLRGSDQRALTQLLITPSRNVSETPTAFDDTPHSRLCATTSSDTWDASLVPLLDAPFIEIPHGVPLFDRLLVESWECEGDRPKVVVSFSANEGSSSIEAFLHGEMRDSKGARPRLKVNRPFYALCSDGEREQSTFLASLEKPIAIFSESHAAVLHRELAISHDTAEGNCCATVEAKHLYVRTGPSHLPESAIFEFALPEGYKLPALHLGHEVNVFEKGWDAVAEFFVSLFTKNKFEASLDGVTVRVVRPSDMLHLNLSFQGLRLKMHSGVPYLERKPLPGGGFQTAYARFEFPSQNLQEESFFEDNLGTPAGKTAPHFSVKTSAAGPSWLLFRLDPPVFKEGLEFSVESLLNWKQFTFLPGNREQNAKGSRIEVPYRLFLTPGDQIAFEHDVSPRTSAEVEEVPESKTTKERAAELWGTLLHDPNNHIEDGEDLQAIEMTAFGASDIAEILKVKVVSKTSVQALLSQKVPVQTGTAIIYRGGTTKYRGTDKEITIEKIFTTPDGVLGIQYKFNNANFAKNDPDFVVPDAPLWLLPFVGNSAVSTQMQVGGVPNPSVDVADRAMIVAITSAPSDKGFKPTRLNVNRLELTALGAYFDTQTEFDEDSVLHIDKQNILRAWKHIAVLNRDSFVELKYAGFLWPFGHRAQLQKRTQRVFFSVFPIDPKCDKAKIFCYLRQQFFIVVKQKTRRYYSDETGDKPKNSTWDFAFRRVDINTLETPPLLTPNDTAYPAGAGGDTWKAFAPQINVKIGDKITPNDVQFDLTGCDWANPGLEIKFKAPLVFVKSDANNSDNFASDAGHIESDLYEKNGRNVVPFGDQHIHLAPPTSAGDTQQTVQSITFRGVTFKTPDATGANPNFYSAVKAASIDLPAVRSFANTGPEYSTVFYESSSYAIHGFTDPNPKANSAEIYLTLDPGANRSLVFPGKHGGGIATPSVPLNSLSRTKGVISFKISETVSAQPNGQLSAKDFFAATGLGANFPKLFGVIPLEDILLAAGDNVPAGFNPFTSDKLPSTLTNLIDGARAVCQQILSLYELYYDPVKQFLGVISDLRALATKEAIAELEQQAKAALVAAVSQQIEAAEKQLDQVVSKAESDLIQTISHEAALPADTVNQIKSACDQAQQQIQNQIVPFLNSLADQIDAALASAEEIKFEIENVVGSLRNILDNARNVPEKVIEQLQDLKSDIIAFASDPLLKSLKDGGATSGDLLASFLKQELQKELTAGKSLASGLGLDIEGPITRFQQKFDQTVDANAALYDQAYRQATSAIQETQKKAIADAASSSYVQQYLQTAAIVNNAVAEAQQAVISKVTDTLVTASSQIVTAVLSDPSLNTEITQTVDQAIKVAELIAQIETYVANLQNILKQPISYGVHYDLPVLPLQTRGIFIGNDQRNQNNASLAIKAAINASVQPADLLQANFKPTFDYRVDSSIQNFGIGLFSGKSDSSFITVYVKSVTFTTRNQEHPTVDFKLDAVEFGAALTYIKDLAESFGILGSGKSGPLIIVSDGGIDLGWTFGLPDIKAGGFRMTGLSFSFAVHLPFDSQPLKLRFYFARPEKHFTISAGIYGGGGYLMLEGGPTLSQPGQGPQCTAIDAFQLCLEFGATTALQLAVASGEAHIMAGTYIAVSNGQCLMSGFVRAGGTLTVIHILTISLEIYIGISYNLSTNTIIGTGSVTVSVSVGFFSWDVTVGMTWTWNNSGGGGAASLLLPPWPGSPEPFSQPAYFLPTDTSDVGPVRMRHMTEAQWEEYASAF
jgi:hypothetical protein